MKKFFFLLAVILFIPFKVNALENPVYFQSPIPAQAELNFNNNYWPTTTFQTVTANSTYHFDLNGGFTSGMQFDTVYVRVAYCVDGSFSKGYSTNEYTLDIDSIRTSIPCEYYGSNYTGGRVAFTTWRYQSAGRVSFTTRVSFVAGNSNISIGLLGVDLSFSSFPLYSETDAILKSNDSLNNRLQTIISQNNTLAYKIDDTNTLFQQFIESQKVCDFIDKNNVVINNKYLATNGDEYSSNNVGITSYLSIVGSEIKMIDSLSSGTAFCFYNANKTLISCSSINSVSAGSTLTIPSNSSYFRSTINTNNNKPTYQICKSGNQAISEQQQQNNQIQQERNDFMNNDNVDESSSTGSDFFSSFNTSSHGLTGIITAPLNLITSITSKTCSPLVLPLPFVNQNITLPCMSSIYSQYFGSFYDIYKIITFGIVAYWVCVRIFNLVKDFKNPEHDEIEVVDL